MVNAKSTLTDQIKRMEDALASSEVRGSEMAIKSILHPEFREIGKSGRMFDLSEILSDIQVPNATSSYEIVDFQVESLSDGIVLATYVIPSSTLDGTNPMSSRRSSIWQKEGGVWLLRFHQGTPLPK